MDFGTRDKTYTNVGLPAEISEEQETNIHIERDGQTVIMTVNGIEETYTVGAGQNRTFYIISDQVMSIVIASYSGSLILKTLSTGVSANINGVAATDGIDISLTYNGTNWSYKSYRTGTSESSNTYAASWIAYPSKTGSYVMYDQEYSGAISSQKPGELSGCWAKDGSTFIWSGFKNLTSTIDYNTKYTWMIAKGNPFDPSSITGKIYSGGSSTYQSFATKSVNVLGVDGDVTKFGGLVIDDSVVSYPEYVSGVFVAPASIFVPGTADKTVMALIDLIPLLLMVGLVVGVIGAYRMRGEAQR